MSERGVSYAEIVAHVERTMELRWHPLYDFLPSRFAPRFAPRFAHHWDFLRRVKGFWIGKTLWYALGMSCRHYVPKSHA